MGSNDESGGAIMKLALVHGHGNRRAALVGEDGVRLIDTPPAIGYGRSATMRLLKNGMTWHQISNTAEDEITPMSDIRLYYHVLMS
jgi:hypothetical protein